MAGSGAVRRVRTARGLRRSEGAACRAAALGALAGAASLLALGGAVAAQTRAPAAAAPAVAPLDFTSRTLPNGLKVYAVRDPRTAMVSVQMWYDVGAKDDPEGRAGFAHLFEHILNRVTRNLARGQLSQIVEDAGGTRNAATAPDFTAYFETVPANQLETMLWLHAERMGRPVVDARVFEAERGIVKEELRERVFAEPYGRLQHFVIPANAFETHPYKRGVGGSLEHLDAAQADDARAFHENFYRPDNASLIVAGDFDPAQLNRWIDKHLAALPRPARPIRRFQAREARRTAAKSVTSYAPNVPLPAVAHAWQTVGTTHPDAPVIEVLDMILAGGRSSRLYRSLVYERQLAQSASTFNDPYKEAGILAAQVVVARGKALEDAEAALAAEIKRFRDEPVTAEELKEAKTELVASALFARQTAQGKAMALGEAVIGAGDPRWADKKLAAIQRVTAADVQRVAREHLREDRRLSIRYLDDKARPGGPAAETTAAVANAPLGLTLPAPTNAPNQLAPEAERAPPPKPTAARPFTTPVFAERRLANGMRVVVARSTDVPVASAYLVFGGGSSADPTNRPGVANMTAALAQTGAGGLSAPELAARIEALGAQIGVNAGFDSTTAFVSAPAADMEAAGRLLAEVVREPVFAPQELERRRKSALDSLAVSLRQPPTVASQVTGRVLYGAAPYGAPPAGTSASLAAMTRDEVVAYHRNWWRPDNATLVITGSLEPAAGFALAERLFGAWAPPAQPMPAAPASRAGAQLPPRVVVVDLPGAGQAAVTVALRAVERSDPDFYPLALANSVLGGSSTSRLSQEVRVKRALSYGADSILSPRREEGLLSAVSQTKNESAAEVAELMLAEIRRLAREPVSAEVLEKRKTFMIGGFARQVETTSGLGGFLAAMAAQGLPMTDFARHMPRLQAVTSEQITASVAAELDPARASIVIVGDAKAFIEPLREAHPTVEVIPADQLDLGSPALRAAR